MTTTIDGQLDFSVELGGRPMAGTLHGSGRSLTLRISDPALLGGGALASARVLAAGLAQRGLSLAIVADRPLITLGVPRARFWERRVTGSPHVSVASLPAALQLVRGRRAARRRGAAPPPTFPLPVAPTFLRRPRRPTTTHDPDRGGYPRLVVAGAPSPGSPTLHRVFPLGDRALVGSDPSCDVVLAGVAPHQAEIVRTEDDELVLRPVRPGSDVRVHGAVVLREALMRTGTRIEIGPWTLVYAREEYADHGRPYGGRLGGELGRQQPQPPRGAVGRRS